MLNFKKIVLRRGTKVVLSQATATIQVGEKVGLIGRNGAGKSSLFALITGQLQEDQGEWSKPDNWEISQVEQHIPETDQGATDFVLEGDLRLGRVLAELHQAELRDDGEAMALAHAALDDAGGHTARSRAQAMLLGGNVRVGLEDNLWLDKGVLATNGSLTERVIEIITRLGGTPMTPAQGREKMGLKKRG